MNGMNSLFESTFLFDPTSNYESSIDDPSRDFLSFSSFASFDLLPSWDTCVASSSKAWSLPQSVTLGGKTASHSGSALSDDGGASSPTLPPFTIVESAFDTPPQTPGLPQTPAHSSRSAATAQESTLSHRSSGSSEWATPTTPSLTTKSSTDSFASFATATPADFFYPSSSSSQIPYSWDDAPSTLGASSSGYDLPSPSPLRMPASNPTLGSARHQPRQTVKSVVSMPALKEEDPSIQWFDGTELTGEALQEQQYSQPSQSQAFEEADVLAEDFDWVFGEYGLGEQVPADSTIFAAFQGDQPQQLESAWMPKDSSAEDMGSILQETSVYLESAPMFTIDPMVVMSAPDESRPSSAPGLQPGETGGLLSVPMADLMSKRSLSYEGHQARHAPPRDLFSYAPQGLPASTPQQQPLYTTEPSPSYNPLGPSHFPRALPFSPPGQALRRNPPVGLTIQIQPQAEAYSTYIPAAPQSADFESHHSSQAAMMQGMPTPMARAGTQPLPMARSGTQPLPQARRMSAAFEASSLPISTPPGMPAHLARAQAIVQMQEAREAAERDEFRRQTASRRVGMAEASVMQPQYAQNQLQMQQQQLPPRHSSLVGWEGPSAQTGKMPVLTHTPLVTVHPPPVTYHPNGTPVKPHRVHPPPHPRSASSSSSAGMASSSSRPIARLPSSPTKPRKASSTTLKRSPAKRSASAQQAPGGGFSWGETTFINFTSDDADKLLTGVAPSGSQSKRKREEDAIKSVAMDEAATATTPERERSKRSRSNE